MIIKAKAEDDGWSTLRVFHENDWIGFSMNPEESRALALRLRAIATLIENNSKRESREQETQEQS